MSTIENPKKLTKKYVEVYIIIYYLILNMDQFTNIYEYLQILDDVYQWKIIETTHTEHITFHRVEMISQKWLGETDTDTHIWKHILCIYIPNEKFTDTGFLRIRSGNKNKIPKLDEDLIRLAVISKSITACIYGVPNQPITFNFEGLDKNPKQGESLLAQSWMLYGKNNNPETIIIWAMVKSVMRAMDTITNIYDNHRGHCDNHNDHYNINKYVIMGASKRGLTAWLTALVDKRVRTIIPLVYDSLNLSQTLNRQKIIYQGYGKALSDFSDLLTDAQMKLMEFIDPYTYLDHLTIQKFLINSTGDEFFLPDSSQYYFHDLKAEKYLCYIPNTGHNVCKKAFDIITPFYLAILNGSKLPKYEWKYENGVIVVSATITPIKVSMWYANNKNNRDFRLEMIGTAWNVVSIPINSNHHGDNIYEAKAPKMEGYVAFFIELVFETITLTTSIYITNE
jgi:PhoPQ-activated pathogenicity-related protein